MKIVVNDISATSGGGLSILKDFYNQIVLNDVENEWIFLLGEKHISEKENIKVVLLPDIKKSWLKRLLFDIFFGRRIINNFKPDVVFSLQNTVTFGVRCSQILYVQQSIPFQKQKHFSFLQRRERIYAIYQYIIGRLIKVSIVKAKRIIVQTKWMAQAVINDTKVNSNKVYVIEPVVDVPQGYGISDEWSNHVFFYPTMGAVYKNNEIFLPVCDELKKRGIEDYSIILTLDKLNESPSQVDTIGRISREEVLKIYSKSVLIFPSYIETFGMPLAEARKVGTIVLASDCAFSHEVLDGYKNAYFFDPFKPIELAVLMEKVIKKEIILYESEEQSPSNVSVWNDMISCIISE